MRKLAIAAAAALTLFDIASASAQSAPFQWTGMYVGAQAGYRWDDSNLTCEECKYEDLSLNLDTGVIGGHLGYNIQPGPLFVLGVETDFSIGNGEDEVEFLGFDGVTLANIKHTWDGSVRARAGYLVMPNILLYGTVGVGFLGEEVNLDQEFGDFDDSKVRVGWQAGAGIEAAINAKWRARAEWIHADYGSSDYSGHGNSDISIDTTTDTFRLGISYALN